jgi:hypothetical protein
LKLDPTVSPATREKVEAMIQKLDDGGWFGECKAIRQLLDAAAPKPKRGWWPFRK